MLLGLMRKHSKSWLIKTMIAVIAIVFVFFFGYSFHEKEGAKVAVVNGELITGVEYRKAYAELLEAMQRQYGSMWSDTLIEAFDLRKRALQGLIDERLLSQEARRIGLSVTEEEIRNEIISYPAFQFQGRFDERRYFALLSQNRMEPEDFESTIAQALLKDKLSQFLGTFLPVTEEEAWEYYDFLNQQVKISFLTLSPDNYLDSVELDSGDIAAYFEENREKYRIPDRISVAYLEVNPEDFMERARVAEEEIRAYYGESIDRYRTRKQIRARHILFRLAQEASQEEEERVRETALEVLQQAREGEDFAELAEAHSQDRSTAENDGGDLGFFSRGEMVRPFEDAAFAMQPGEISELVRTPFGYHIIKVEEVRDESTRPLEEVREDILATLKGMAAADMAHEKALSLIDQMPYDMDLKSYASELGMSAENTPFFSRDEDVPGIGGNERLREVLFSLPWNSVSDVMEHDGRFYIFQLIEEKPSYLPDLEQVISDVRKDLLLERARDKAEIAAQEILDRLREGEDWNDLADSEGLAVNTSEFFQRNERIRGIGLVQDVQEAAFALDGMDPYPQQVYESVYGFHVIRWEDSKGIDEEEFEKEKAKVKASLRGMNHHVMFSSWLENLRARADIKILATL